MNKLLLTACSATVALMIGTIAASAHGCHHDPQPGKYGWHRHVGPYCERVDAPPPGYYEGRRHRHEGPPPPRCREECVGVGPLRVCDKKCY